MTARLTQILQRILDHVFSPGPGLRFPVICRIRNNKPTPYIHGGLPGSPHVGASRDDPLNPDPIT
jgi:hypothetical protein